MIASTEGKVGWAFVLGLILVPGAMSQPLPVQKTPAKYFPGWEASQVSEGLGQAWITAIAFSHDGNWVALGGSDRIRLFERKSGKPSTISLPVEQAVGLAFVGRQLLVSADHRFELTAWDATTGKRVYTLANANLKQSDTNSRHLAVSRDGRLLVECLTRKVRCWQIGDHRAIKQTIPKGLDFDGVECLALSDDRRCLAVGRTYQPRTAEKDAQDAGLVWDLVANRPILILREEPGVQVADCRLSSDGRLLAWSVNVRDQQLSGRIDSKPSLRVTEVISGGEIFRRHYQHNTPLWQAFSADGRLLVSPELNRDVVVWDLGTGEEAERSPFPDGHARLGRFVGDGKLLAFYSYSPPHSCLNVIDFSKPKKRQPKQPTSEREALPRLWSDLFSKDAAKARRAVWRLIDNPRQAVELLKARLRPAPAYDDSALKKVLARLDDRRFAERQKASKELEQFDRRAIPALRKFLDARPSADAALRVRQALERLEALPITAESIGKVRCNEVLEKVGTPQARKLLETMANGAPGEPETEDARAALARLDARQKQGR